MEVVCSTPEMKFQPRLLPKCTPYFCVLGDGSAECVVSDLFTSMNKRLGTRSNNNRINKTKLAITK